MRRPALRARIAHLAPALLALLAAPAAAQDIEHVYVPEERFEQVLQKHPRGVVLAEGELEKLIRAAAARPAPKDPVAPAPLAATVERLRVTGRVEGEVAHLEAVAEVAVLRAGTVRLPLPLSGVGLRSVRLGDGDKAARVIQTRRGPEVLLLGSSEGPVVRTVRWSFAVRAEPGEERGSGRIEFPVPATASGRVVLDVPGDVEVARGDGSLLWTTPNAGRTQITGAFGGRGRAPLRITWRPRRSLQTLRSYAVAESRSVFLVQPGVVTLEAASRLEVYRAGRDRFTLRLPAGFVVRALRLAQGEVAYVQRKNEIEVRLNAPRKGVLQLQMRAELATGTERKAETLTLRPLGFKDVDRVAGIVGFAASPESLVTFGEVQGLERDDLGVLGARLPSGRLLRVYRRGGADGASAKLTIEPVDPKVDLAIKAALALAEREVRAVVLYRYEVEAGSVYSVRARLPQGYAFETATVRDGSGGAVAHQRKELIGEDAKTKRGYTDIVLDLEKGLRAGQALVLTVQATRQVPKGLAGKPLSVPRFGGAPAERIHGHIGFAPDEAFRLDGTALRSLVAIPAEELPRVGVDVAGLVLGYRIEGKEYGGRVDVIRKETQVTAEVYARHQVHERVIDSNVHMDLEVEGGPLKELELLLPKGTGLLARIEGPDVLDDRKLLGVAQDGRERWKIQFDERKLGRFALQVRLSTKLEAGNNGGQISASLPRVSVAEVFSERGTLAVYSSDATEVVAEPTGLRAIEVTEVPQRIQAGDQRPLFAYTHVGSEHELLLSIRRPGTGEVLTAVAEQLAVETSTGPDGTSRHTATWQVKNLNNQFFALRLPQDAVLWSVVVDGEGVKPAERDGLQLIPIPTAGEKGPGQSTTVKASYTLKSDSWGVFGRAGLEAPVLMRGHDPVPVLTTRWQLSLPDDYRVVEVEGNLRGAEVVPPRPLVLSLFSTASEAGWPIALLILGLLGLSVGASQTLRARSLSILAGLGGAASGVGGVGRLLIFSRKVQFGCGAILGAILVFGLCVIFGMTAKDMAPTARYEAEMQDSRLATRDFAPADSPMQDPAASAPGMGGGSGAKYDAAVAEEPAPPPLAKPMSPARSPMPKGGPMDRITAGKKVLRDVMKEKAKRPSESRRQRLGRLRSELAQRQGRGRRAEDEKKSREDRNSDKDGRGFADELGDDDAEEGWGDEGDEAPDMEMEPSEDLPPMDEAPDDPMDPERAPENSEAMPETGESRLYETEDRVESLFREIERLAQDRQVEELVGKFSELRQVMSHHGDDPHMKNKLEEWNQRLSSFGETRLSLEAQLYIERGNKQLRLLRDAKKRGDAKKAGEHYSRIGTLVDEMRAEEREFFHRNADALWNRAEALYTGKTIKTLKAKPGLGGFGQVGLRSLVLQLPAVGSQHAFDRPGGDAQLELSFVREATLVTLCGLLALATFLLTLFLPRSGKVSAAGLALIGLGVLTAAPTLAGGAWATPLLNAAAAGILLALPVAGLVALGRVWEGGPFARLRRALRARRSGVPAGASRVAVAFALACCLWPCTDASVASAQERGKVYVPYDSKETPDPTTSKEPRKVYVPLDVYEDLLKRARPEGPAAEQAPPVPYVVADASYGGTLDGDGLRLTATARVGVLAKGWQRVFLGLQGTGLEDAKVSGSLEGAKVRVAPTGGFELVAQGPGSYLVELSLVVPKRSGGYVFSTVPSLAATLKVTADAGGRALVVDGARAQTERDLGDGKVEVDASLGDARQITLSLRSREVLSAGASEASAETRSIVWVRRGRAAVLSETTFTISGTGREGFVFTVPEGFEVTDVGTPGLRSWRQDGARVELSLRRPTGRTATVRLLGEQQLKPGQTTFEAPQVAAQGVSREAGKIGLCVEPGLRVRPVRPQLRQQDPGDLRGLAGQLKAGAVERAYSFHRRPSQLELELVSEDVEVKADGLVKATVLADLYLVEAELSYDVSRGKLYRLDVVTPAGLELVGTPSGLDVREVTTLAEDETSRTYRLGLASGLTGSGKITLTLAKRLSFGDRTELPFPDVRPLGVRRETASLALAAGPGLEVRVPTDPKGLVARDVRNASRLGAARSGARWRLAYARASGRVPGLATGTVKVRRPTPYVTGSWVLHARVERDVVRYALRALYEIENAGVQTFNVLVPARAGERVEVEAQNQREVTSTLASEDTRRFTIELQSPAEIFYDLAVSWEETLVEGKPFELPKVGIDGVDHQVKGFVLVEKAAEVVDVLEELTHEGDVNAGVRASEAPALPPGKGPRDFVLVYQIPLDRGAADWKVRCRLKKAAVALPPPARIPFAHVESVFTQEGEVRHRVRYRVRNLRLQFLTLSLPKGAKVWSVFVDGQPKRLHQTGTQSLIPLPNRSAADLSFDVELTYATPSSGQFGFGESLELTGPVLQTPEVEVEETFWTVYTPDGFDVRGFSGNVEGTAAEAADAKVLDSEVKELEELADLAQRATGKKKEVADYNLRAQQVRIDQQIQVCRNELGSAQGPTKGEAGKAFQKAQTIVSKNDVTYKQLKGQIQTRRKADSEKQRKLLQGQQQLLQQDVLEVEGNTFDRAQSGWTTNRGYFKKGNKVQWSNLGQNDAPNAPAQKKGKGQSAYTLVVPEGQELELDNVQVDRESQVAQRRRGGNYGYYRQQQADQQSQQKQLQEQLGKLQKQQTEVDVQTADPNVGFQLQVGGARADAGERSEGLLSIRVSWEPKGRPWHFAGDTQEAPVLGFTTYPEGSRGSFRTAASAICLLVLLAGLVRLGLLAQVPGQTARRALLLLAGLGLAALVFVHPVTAALTFFAGLWAIKHGPLGAVGAEVAA